MSIIRLNAQNCQNCYKCIRECHLKAIEFKDNKTKIMESECVLCGTCMEICPRGAKYFRCNTDRVKELLASEKPVYVSLAPSYVGWYDQDFDKISDALKKLGFAGVEETAIGANIVSKEYANLMKAGQMKNIIATACSSVVMLIERHFPDLVKMLAPVSSPMMAHARLMRETYGNIKVIFIGPCLSKMEEA
ncbi:MAG: [Fe-Fe] hydrogenase large subunit C-terminal domain-containing protein, partial [Oscillospiraceae bacterium]